MTEEGLADALSISKHVMSKSIKGSKSVNVSELAKIASIIGTTIDSLLMVNTNSEAIESMA